MQTYTRPSTFVRFVIRPMTKVLNPVSGRVAGRTHFALAAQLTHTGRRSGKTYVTPVSARPCGDHMWVALTFGTGSDWCRNVVAARGCTVRWRGCDYVLAWPQVVDRATALAMADGAFKGHERAMLRAMGIADFLRLDIVGAA